MRTDLWTVEIYVKYNPMDAQIFNLTVRTFGFRKDAAIKSAKSKVIACLKKQKKPFEQLRLMWIEHSKTVEKSSYDCFVELKEKSLKKKAIMHQMKMSYSEFLFFDNYYEGRTKKLTYPKYLYLKQFMRDEQIQKRCKIPKSEFLKFVKSHGENHVSSC
ncbi:TPA: hypothetical protein RFK82_000873 [Listeria monocytogenes]|uniref:hypothetical protein n=1 Tax=Listeria seeligeri TaxID=1640 RepID=UPI0016268460|nr:hypothetical protein [Listeria seeligeri]HAO6496189.1 hypothetical protein [Listeria monocytogenes]MBC1540590.1 hypothetical protein [Listeria seeligeri]MBC1581603.1 hypothetical protein [Listeria seeligeri]MBC1736596.1 hypothetical protein [Listeria seeligeri]MBC2208755.1 hypothetical protein [Listeria seeligeri]